MYMGVILVNHYKQLTHVSAPHVYGGDPLMVNLRL